MTEAERNLAYAEAQVEHPHLRLLLRPIYEPNLEQLRSEVKAENQIKIEGLDERTD